MKPIKYQTETNGQALFIRASYVRETMTDGRFREEVYERVRRFIRNNVGVDIESVQDSRPLVPLTEERMKAWLRRMDEYNGRSLVDRPDVRVRMSWYSDEGFLRVREDWLVVSITDSVTTFRPRLPHAWFGEGMSWELILLIAGLGYLTYFIFMFIALGGGGGG